MPAINLRNLETQIQKMETQIGNPETFYLALKDLYEYYTDRTFKPNPEKISTVLLPTYKLLPQVQRSILFYLSPNIKKIPAQSLKLAKELWKKSHYEYKELAIMLLGKIPFQKNINILDILSLWASETNEETLRKKIATDGITTIIRENPTELLEWISNFLKSDDNKTVDFSFFCLLSFIDSNPNKLLPDILLILKETLSPPNKNLFHHYANIIHRLNDFIPRETLFFLSELEKDYPKNKIVAKLSKI